MRLTDKAVAGLVAGKSDVIFFDSELKGFGYRMRGGRRSWIVQYRSGGVHRRYRVGDAAVLGAEQARAAARKILARVALGEDPQGDRRRSRGQLTLRAVADEFLETKRPRVRAKSLAALKRYLTGPYFRGLHAVPVDKVSRRDIAARLVVIEREIGAIVAGKARAAISAMFAWAMQAGIVEANPAIGTPLPPAGRPRERVLSDDELAAVWRAADGAVEFGRIVRLLVLTAARRSEIGGMAWPELDFDAGVWTLPGARSKNGRPHALPLMPAMSEILGAVPRRVGRDQLFGERSTAGFRGWAAAKLELDRRAGVAGWTLHDLRRTAATRMADLGVAQHIIEEILNHQSGHKRGPAGIYNRSRYEREVKAALALWHDHVRAIAAGGAARKILPFAPHDAS